MRQPPFALLASCRDPAEAVVLEAEAAEEKMAVASCSQSTNLVLK